MACSMTSVYVTLSHFSVAEPYPLLGIHYIRRGFSKEPIQNHRLVSDFCTICMQYSTFFGKYSKDNTFVLNTQNVLRKYLVFANTA